MTNLADEYGHTQIQDSGLPELLLSTFLSVICKSKVRERIHSADTRTSKIN